MQNTTHTASKTYLRSGVDTEAEETALHRLTSRIKKTWPMTDGVGSVKLDVGFFANVIDVGGLGLAITTDGVGTKALVAQMMQKYDTIGIDCVAMNVNDLLCVGARPVSMVDYIAVQELNTDLLDEIAKGLCEGAAIAKVSIPGGEIAQLRDIIKGAREGAGFDLAGTAIGVVPLDKIIVGKDIEDGDAIIAIESNGVHSNGLTLARQVLFEEKGFTVHTRLHELDCTLGEELLKPTHIYVQEAIDLLDSDVPVKALIHITSDGLLNLVRVASDVGYVIDELPPIPPIFSLIQEHGNTSMEEMFRVFNMGVGFCVIVPPDQAEHVASLIHSHRKKAYKIGYAVRDAERRVFIKPYHLVGKGGRFHKD